MKIIEFRGGLGNQLFEYAHYLYLKEKYPAETFYSYFPHRELWMHNGLELHKHFSVELPPTSVVSNFIGTILYNFGLRPFLGCIAKYFISSDANVADNKIMHEGYWQDKQYFDNDFRFRYINVNLSDANKQVREKMAKTNSVSIHIRRGDYLTCDNPEQFSGICTPQYYSNAIQFISAKIENPHFFIFSDDSEYVRQTFSLPNQTIVDWNKGADSYIDMYLMSECKAMILANSTFSFWAAQNNKNNPLVVCPTRWNNNAIQPQLTMHGWIEIPSF